jgi:hypothetical protein
MRSRSAVSHPRSDTTSDFVLYRRAIYIAVKPTHSTHQAFLLNLRKPIGTKPQPNPKHVSPSLVLDAGTFASDMPSISGPSSPSSLSLFNSHTHTLIDMAPTYPIDSSGANEIALGAQADILWARISTKVSAIGKNTNALEKVCSGLEARLKRLQGKRLTFFIFICQRMVRRWRSRRGRWMRGSGRRISTDGGE